MKGGTVLFVLLAATIASASAHQSSARAGKQTVYNPTQKGGSRQDPIVRRAYSAHFNVIDRPTTQFTLPTPENRILPSPVYDSGRLLTGDCLVAFVVTGEGRVVEPVVLESSDRRLNTSALEAVRDWRYTPARLDGSPVEIIFGARVPFQPTKMTVQAAAALSLYTPKPPYPTSSSGQHHIREGLFQLRFQTSTGTVTSIKILKSTGDKAVDGATMKTLINWRFRPRGPDFVNVPITFR